MIRHFTRDVEFAFSLRSFAMMYATNKQRQPSLLGLYPNSPISEMTGDEHDYQAYLLRLWRVNIGRGAVWHASLEDPHTGERTGFVNLKNLCTFLEEQTKDFDQRRADEKKGQAQS